MVPTLLDEVGSNVLTILWFFIIIIWSLIPSILTILGIIDTMTENFPMLMKYRICFCTFTNLLCFTISACVLTENFLPNVHIWSSTGWPALCAVMIVIYTLIIFIHSMKKIALAYTTVYIKSLGKFWQNFLTLGQTIVICLVLYKIYTNYTLSIQGHTKTVTMLSVLIVVVCFLPILLGVIWIFGKSKNIKDPNTSTIRKVSSLKQKRKLLLSGHYEMIRCEHNCLLNSKKLEELIVAADIKNKFISNYIEDNRKNK